MADKILIRFNCAGIPLAVSCTKNCEGPFNTLLCDYQSSSEPAYSLDVEVTSDEVRSEKDLVERFRRGEYLDLVKISRISPSKYLARIDCAQEDIASAAVGLFVSNVLSENDGILVHASAHIKNNRPFVFVGPSGAGKSTIIRNTSGTGYVHDDRVILRKVSNTWKIFCAPMLDNEGVPGRSVSARLRELYFIKKSRKFAKKKIPPGKSILNLGSQTVAPFTDVASLSSIFKTILDCVESVGCYELSFPKNQDVISYLSG